MRGGVTTYIASLRLAVAFAPKEIIACLRQVVAFAPKVINACLRQVVAFAPHIYTNAPPTSSQSSMGGGMVS